MPDKKHTIQTTTRATLAKQYNVKPETFTKWINANPALKKILAPYLRDGNRALPPAVTRSVFEILGEP